MKGLNSLFSSPNSSKIANEEKTLQRSTSLPNNASKLAKIGDVVAIQIAPNKIRPAVLLNWTLRNNVWCAYIAWMKSLTDNSTYKGKGTVNHVI